MADNVSISAGTGTDIATDQAGDGSHVQLFKLVYAADGSKVLVPADADGLAVKQPDATKLLMTEASAALILTAAQSLATALRVTPATVTTGIVGPMVQGVVADSPASYTAGTVQPLSLTPDGRMRVSTVGSDATKVWQHTDSDPWAQSSPWDQENPYG